MKRQYIDFIPYNDNISSPFEDEPTLPSHQSYVQNLEKPYPKLGVVEAVSYDDTSFDDEVDDIPAVRHTPTTSAYHSYPIAPSLQSSNSENLTNKPLILRKPRTISQPMIERQKEISGYHPPKIPFINTQVEKRPLSKNIYATKLTNATRSPSLSTAKPAANSTKDLRSYFKQSEHASESQIKSKAHELDSEEMLRVVDEPEKKSHAGIIFAIVASILLGTAAGVVIYLFFP